MSLTRVARRQSFYSATAFLLDSVGGDSDGSTPPPGAEITPAGPRFKYELETYFEGETEAESGMVVNLSTLDERLAGWLKPEADEKPAEFLQRLAGLIIKARPFPGARVVKLRLYLDEDHWIDVWP